MKGEFLARGSEVSCPGQEPLLPRARISPAPGNKTRCPGQENKQCLINKYL